MRNSVPLREAADITLGKMRTAVGGDEGTQCGYLRAANVNNGWLDLDEIKTMGFDPREQDRYRLCAGDVLITEASGSRDQVGQTAVVTEDAAGLMFQNHLVRLRPRPGTDARFLYWWSRHAFASGKYAAAAQGLGIWHLSAERLRRLDVTMPSLDEQVGIARFLDDQVGVLERLVALRDEQSRLVEERTAAQVRELALRWTGPADLADSGHAWMGEIPATWRVARLRFEARLESGHTPSRTRPELWEDCTIPWVSLNDVGAMLGSEYVEETSNKISEAGIAASSARLLPAGTVVLSRDATIGRCAILARPMATSQHFANWVCSSSVLPRYLWLLFRYAMQPYFDSLTDGATIRTIGMGDLRNFVIPLPDVADQQAIVTRASIERRDGEGMQRAVEQHSRLLRERAQALIAAAVTGDLDVTTASSAA